jgi:hypothetical protein
MRGKLTWERVSFKETPVDARVEMRAVAGLDAIGRELAGALYHVMYW